MEVPPVIIHFFIFVFWPSRDKPSSYWGGTHHVCMRQLNRDSHPTKQKHMEVKHIQKRPEWLSPVGCSSTNIYGVISGKNDLWRTLPQYFTTVAAGPQTLTITGWVLMFGHHVDVIIIIYLLVVHWVKQGEKGYALCIPHIKWLMIGWEVGSSIGRSQENHLTWLKSQWLGNHLMFAAYKKDIKFHARYWLLMIIFLYIYIYLYHIWIQY